MPKLDALLAEGRAVTDPEKRAAVYGEAQKIIMDSALWFPVHNQVQTIAYRAGEAGLPLRPRQLDRAVLRRDEGLIAMHALTGYADRWSVRQGDAIRFMVSSAGGRDFALRFVRHICADPNPAGPGYAEIPMPSAIDGTHRGQGTARATSAASAMSRRCRSICAAACCLSATIWPTTPGKGRQGLIALRIGRLDAGARHRPGRRSDGGSHRSGWRLRAR